MTRWAHFRTHVSQQIAIGLGKTESVRTFSYGSSCFGELSYVTFDYSC
jgi:hypothetical protein